MKTNGNEPAHGFAMTTADGSSHVIENGLTKREIMAKDFMAALIASGTKNDTPAVILAKIAISLTDALITALNEKE